MNSTEDYPEGGLREGYAEVGDQRLHYVEAGQGPLVVLLHGFPEFWPSPNPTTSPAWTGSNGCPAPRTGSTTTKPTASPSCSPTSLPRPARRERLNAGAVTTTG